MNEIVAKEQMTNVLTAFELLDNSFDVALKTNVTLDEFQKFVQNYEEKVATKLKEWVASASQQALWDGWGSQTANIQVGNTVIKKVATDGTVISRQSLPFTCRSCAMSEPTTHTWGVVKAVHGDKITVVYTAHDKGSTEIAKLSDLTLTTVKPCACGRVFDPEEQAVLEVLLGSVPANVTKQLSNCSTSFSLFHCEPFS